jgi:hypothetical protein
MFALLAIVAVLVAGNFVCLRAFANFEAEAMTSALTLGTGAGSYAPDAAVENGR